MPQKGNVIIVNDFRGINVEAQPFAINENESQVAHNVLVKQRSVEVRGGYELFAEDATSEGGVTMMQPYYKRDGTDQLVFSNNGAYSYVTPANQTWQVVGSQGATTTENPTAFQTKDILLFGTGQIGNTTQKWDGTTLSAVAVPPDTNADVRFFEHYQGADIDFIVAAGTKNDDPAKNSTTLYYTDDPNNWGAAPAGTLQIGASDGQDLTGLATENQLVAYKQFSKYYLSSFYEEFSGAFILRNQGKVNSSGAPSHESLLKVDGDILSLTEKGKSIEGFGLEGTATGLARPKQYATNINPILFNITWNKQYIEKTRAAKYDRWSLYSFPYLGSTTNTITLWGDLDTTTNNGQPSWTTSSIRAGSFAKFRDENGLEELYIGDSLQPKIYKYTPNTYSDNGFEYTRIWKSKKFNFFSQADFNDDFFYVILAGSMRTITEFELKTIVDGKTQAYIIDKTQIVASGSASGGGGYVGGQYIGGEYTGGNPAETDKFRYLAVAQIPNSQKYAHEVEIQLKNSGIGQFWSMDYLSINEQINYENLPPNHKNLRST